MTDDFFAAVLPSDEAAGSGSVVVSDEVAFSLAPASLSEACDSALAPFVAAGLGRTGAGADKMAEKLALGAAVDGAAAGAAAGAAPPRAGKSSWFGTRWVTFFAAPEFE